MPQPCIPPRGKPEKKAVFSPYYGDETTTNYNRVYKKMIIFNNLKELYENDGTA